MFGIGLTNLQGTVPERNYVFPVHLPHQKPIRRAEKCNSRQSEGANLSASLEQRKKVDEDDFRVPVYVHSRIGQYIDKSVESFDGNKLTPTGSRYFGGSIAGQSDCERDPKQFGSSLVNMRKDARIETDSLPQISASKEQPLRSLRSISTGENIDTLTRQAKVTPNQEFQDCHISKLNRLRQGDTFLHRDCGVGPLSSDIEDAVVESPRETNKGNTLMANQTSPAQAINGTEHHNTRMGTPIMRGNLNKSDNASKISLIENFSTEKISPDDVVGIIGQKHFWKARREIAK